MNKILEKLGQYGIVPVVVLNDSKDAEPLADALAKVVLLVRKLLSVQRLLPNLSES